MRSSVGLVLRWGTTSMPDLRPTHWFAELIGAVPATQERPMPDLPTHLAAARSLLAAQARAGANYALVPLDQLRALLDATGPPDQDAMCLCTLCNLTVAEHQIGVPP